MSDPTSILGFNRNSSSENPGPKPNSQKPAIPWETPIIAESWLVSTNGLWDRREGRRYSPSRVFMTQITMGWRDWSNYHGHFRRYGRWADSYKLFADERAVFPMADNRAERSALGCDSNFKPTSEPVRIGSLRVMHQDFFVNWCHGVASGQRPAPFWRWTTAKHAILI